MDVTRNDNPSRIANALRGLAWGAAACVLLAPAVAMRLEVEGVDWTAGDFVFAALLLATACGLLELALRMSGSWLYRIAGAAAIGGGLTLVWANLAVGLVGDGANAWNLAFMGVLGVGVVGALASRFRARGLSTTFAAMAIAHGAVVAWALVSGPDPMGASLSALWLVPWLAAATLFAMAGREKV